MKFSRTEPARPRAAAEDVGEKLAAYEAGKREIADTARSAAEYEYERELAALAERLGV